LFLSLYLSQFYISLYSSNTSKNLVILFTNFNPENYFCNYLKQEIKSKPNKTDHSLVNIFIKISSRSESFFNLIPSTKKTLFALAI
jgi:hypothetical protein